MASFFHTNRKVTANTTKTAHVGSVEKTETPYLKSDDPTVQAFYDQLTDKERIAHTIAVDKLGTSYDVTRTHGYLRYIKNQK